MGVLVAATVLLLYILIQPSQRHQQGLLRVPIGRSVRAGQGRRPRRYDSDVTLKSNSTYTVESDSPLLGDAATIDGWLTDANVPKPWPTYEVKHPADTVGSSSCSQRCFRSW